MFIRSPYNYDLAAASDASGLACSDPSLTKQAFAEEADINTIVRRFRLTGEMPEGIVAPEYSDFEGIWDYHSALNAIAQARESFDAMPAAIRARFRNDPGEFVEFCSNAGNRKELEDMGLIVKGRTSETVQNVVAGAGSGEGVKLRENNSVARSGAEVRRTVEGSSESTSGSGRGTDQASAVA